MEIWKNIKGYENKYQVSNMGNVKSLNYKKTGKENILKPQKNYKGYLSLTLYNNNYNRKQEIIHRLVVQTFIPNPENKPQVNHKNGIRDDNRLENLEWCTISENLIHSFDVLGRKPPYLGKFGKNHNCSKKVNQYSLEGEFIKTWDAFMDINRELGLNIGSLWLCCNKKRNIKKVGNFIWKYN